jgi:hypothetical protein
MQRGHGLERGLEQLNGCLCFHSHHGSPAEPAEGPGKMRPGRNEFQLVPPWRYEYDGTDFRWAPTVRPRPCDPGPTAEHHQLSRLAAGQPGRGSCTSNGYSRLAPGCVCPELAAGCETDRMALKPTRPLALAEFRCSANPGLPRNPSQVNSCRTSKPLRQSLHHSTRRWLKKGRLTSEPCRGWLGLRWFAVPVAGRDELPLKLSLYRTQTSPHRAEREVRSGPRTSNAGLPAIANSRPPTPCGCSSAAPLRALFWCSPLFVRVTIDMIRGPL